MRSKLVLLLILASSVGMVAQEKSAPLSECDVRALLERIDRLEKRVAELETRKASAEPLAQAASAQMPQQQPSTGIAGPYAGPAHDVQTPGMQAQIGEGESFPSLHIRGFADVDFSAVDSPGGSRSGFSVGQFVLHFASRLSKKISYFGEVSLTAQPNLYNVDLERSFIRYDVNDTAKISFGRYHTPINYWNTAFHHGAWLQTTISRPDMIRFGGSFEPVHFIGAQSEGSIPSGGLNVGYNLAIGNGRGSLFSRGGDAGDVNNNRAWLVNVFSRPTPFKRLQVGGSYYRDRLSSTVGVGGLGVDFNEWIAAGHLVWTGESPEFLAEFANVHHRSDVTGSTFDSQGGYAQIAYRLPIWEKRWKPYFRYDYIQVPAGEPTFSLNVSDVRGFTLGTRYDISDFAALKAEYRNGRATLGTDRANSVVVQTAFTF